MSPWVFIQSIPRKSYRIASKFYLHVDGQKGNACKCMYMNKKNKKIKKNPENLQTRNNTNHQNELKKQKNKVEL